MTTAAVPSTNPIDFLLNVETLDRAINSSELTFTDRLGGIKPTVRGALNTLAAFNPRGAWASATPYAIKDVYTSAGLAYVAVVAHTSTSIASDLAAGKVTIHQGATREDILKAYASDNEGTSNLAASYASVSVNKTRTTIDRHAFEDWSTLSTTDTGQGYCSFDAKATMTNGLIQNHLVGYQSRNIYSGAAGLNGYMHGYDTDMGHNGTGTIAKVRGMFIKEIGGTGPITENIGLVIDPMTRGASNAGIFSGPGNYHYLGGFTGSIETGAITATALNFGVDTVGKVISIGYGSAGTSNFGVLDFYDGKTNLIASLGKDGLFLSTPVKPGSYLFANLPTGFEGQTAYCTNGRKVWEDVSLGTGVPVYFSAGAWRVYSTDAVVTI